MSGASDDVNKNRKAACPLGVAILGMFVPVFIAIVRLLKCSRVIFPASSRAFTSFI
tara:strand:+ start:5631 stop:5798 length:168 start_codon:yes stop_codon:yes gene_type:complete